MIKNLQKKFVMTTMIAVSIVMLLFLVVVNGIHFISIQRDEEKIIQLILEEKKEASFKNTDSSSTITSESKPKPPEHPNNSSLNFEQYFIVKLSENGKIIEKDISHDMSITDEEVEKYSQKAFQRNKTTGTIKNYKYQNNKELFGKTHKIVFLDISPHEKNIIRIFAITVFVGAITWILLLVFAVHMSKKATLPIAKNMEKQKQFITNAGHEIKTPLAIIQSNADVLSLHYGENKWLVNIKKQIKRLDELTQNLLLLTKSDEQKQIMEGIHCFDTCKVLEELIQEYDALIKEKELSLLCNIEEGSLLFHSEKAFRQIANILLDNAIKYTPKKGKLSIEIEKEKNGIYLIQKNSIEGEREKDPNLFFERFYRQDVSRTQKTGGSGIGLSIVSTLMHQMKGHINVKYTDENTICFTAFFPQMT